MRTAYITIVTLKQTNEELAFGSAQYATEWLNEQYPDLHLQPYVLWNAKLAEGNIYETEDFSIRKIRRIVNY